MACLVPRCMSDSGSWQTLPKKSLYALNVLNGAAPSCGGRIPAGQRVSVRSRRSAVPCLLPLWPLLHKCLSFFLNLAKLFPSALSHYSSVFPAASLQVTRCGLIVSARLLSLLGSACVGLNSVRCKRESKNLTELRPLISPFWVFSPRCALFCTLTEDTFYSKIPSTVGDASCLSSEVLVVRWLGQVE